jgi:hypothetical protein
VRLYRETKAKKKGRERKERRRILTERRETKLNRENKKNKEEEGRRRTKSKIEKGEGEGVETERKESAEEGRPSSSLEKPSSTPPARPLCLCTKRRRTSAKKSKKYFVLFNYQGLQIYT